MTTTDAKPFPPIIPGAWRRLAMYEGRDVQYLLADGTWADGHATALRTHNVHRVPTLSVWNGARYVYVLNPDHVRVG